MIPPVVFAALHLAILAALCVGAAISARPSRMRAGRHRGTRYAKLTTSEMLRRLDREKRSERR